MNKARYVILCIFMVLSVYNNIYAQNIFELSPPVNIENINSAKDDFAPVWNSEESVLYFNSDRSGYSMFYTVDHYDSLSFDQPRLIRNGINQSKNNQSYISFLNKNEAIYSTFRMAERRPYMNLFSAIRKKNAWNKTALISSLKCECFASHPTVSPDGSTLIFSTTRGSDKGDTDLWASFMQDDRTWSQPVFINELNTSGNEITPFLLSKDTLFFTSNGQGGPGGYDIFYSVKSKGIWQKPFPLNDLNTEYDESDFTIIPGNLAVFASNRPEGQGGLDLWAANIKHEIPKDQKYLADFELSVAMQASNIKAHRDIQYSYYYLPNIISIEEYLLPVFTKDDFRVITCRYDPDLEMVYFNFFSILAEKFNINSKKIIMTCFGFKPDTSEVVHSILDFFEQNHSIDNQRFIIQSIGNIKTEKKYIAFEIEDKEQSSMYKFGKDSIALMPPVVEFSIDARPRRFMRSWEISSFLDGNDTIAIKNGVDVPARTQIDLREHKCKTSLSDSLIFEIIGMDSLNRKAKEVVRLPVIHSVSEKAETFSEENKEFYEYNIILFDSIFHEKFSFYKEFFDHFRKNYEPGKKIIIFYHAFGRIGSDTEDNAKGGRIKQFINVMREKINFSDNDIEIRQYKEKNSYSTTAFNENTIRILIEK